MGDLHPEQMYMDHEAATLPLNTNKLSAMRAEAKIEPQGGNESGDGEKKPKEKKPKKKGSGAGAAASRVLSFVYAKLILVACVAFLLTEIATYNIPLFFFEGFFTYLYGIGIIFFLYAFSCMLGGPGSAARGKRSRKVASGSKLTVNLFQAGQSGTYNVAEYNREADEGRGQMEGGVTSPSQQDKMTESLISGGGKEGRYCGTKADASHGNIFLRVGAFLFGIGTLLYCAIELVAALFEIPRTSICYDLIAGINPGLQAGFTLLQMIFLLVNTKLNINKFKVVARLGLMHLVATNICVWLRTIVREGLKDFTKYYVKHKGGPSEDQMIIAARGNLTGMGATATSTTPSPYSGFGSSGTDTADAEGGSQQDLNATSCHRMSILGTIRDDLAPYLYPNVVQFSFAAAAILFVMWLHVGRSPRFVNEFEEDLDAAESCPTQAALAPTTAAAAAAPGGDADNAGGEGGGEDGDGADDESDPSARVCAGARKGLVFGVLLVLCAAAATVCYFVLLDMPEFKAYAVYLADSAHSALLLLSLLVVWIGFCRVKKLKFDPNKEDLLNVLLLRVSGFAVLLYATLTVIAAALRLVAPALDVPTLLVLVTASLTILEIAFQAPFVLDANKRAIHKVELNVTKPGRQLVTFLLLTNLAMFGIYVVEAQKVDRLPVQLNFYGYLPWVVLLKLVLPLCIFHRFHAVTLLAEVWRKAYKPKQVVEY